MNSFTLNRYELPKKTLAAILVNLHKPLVVDEVLLPRNLLFGQVLVKVLYSTICGAQLNEIDGAKGPDIFLPHLLGHEASARVIATGDKVTNVKVGDTVVMHWRKGAGLEGEPARYTWKGKPLSAGWVTTFQYYSVVSENRLTTIPPDTDLRLASLLGCAVTTAFGVINNDAHVKVGQSVVVYGAGGVGLNIIQAASLVSAYPIIAIDLYDEKLELAKKFGATSVINGKKQKNVEKLVRAMTGEKGSDVVIDTTGNGRIIQRCYELTHPEGKTILVGVTKKEDTVSIYTLPLHFGKVLTGSHGGDSLPHVDIPRYIQLMRAKKLNLDGLITHNFTLTDINQAISVVRSGKAGRVELDL